MLLDAEVSVKDSSKKHNETAFMHKFYAPVTYDGQQYIAKISVEEYGARNQGRRFYNLRGIKIDPAGGAPDGMPSYGTVPDAKSMISISDLFALVKQYDKEFQPKPANPVPLLKFTKKSTAHIMPLLLAQIQNGKRFGWFPLILQKNSSPVTQEVDVTSPNLNVRNDLTSPDATIDSISESSENVNSNTVRDRGMEIGVRPSEMDTTFKEMGEWQRQKVLTTLEKNTGTKIVLVALDLLPRKNKGQGVL